jgi:hypothetical protein
MGSGRVSGSVGYDGGWRPTHAEYSAGGVPRLPHMKNSIPLHLEETEHIMRTVIQKGTRDDGILLSGTHHRSAGIVTR